MNSAVLVPPVADVISEVVERARMEPRESRVPVTVVIPCCNEEPVVPVLAATLAAKALELEREYDLRFVVVDDCSQDRTWDRLCAAFGDNPDFILVRHPKNAGVAAAILTGIRQAETEIVCSIDCDGTYDLAELGSMVPLLLGEGVDAVTASPYHALGRVENVPGWRLVLSRTASSLYRRVLRHKLATYTSCFRVYRRPAVVDLRLWYGGFVGIAEILGRLDLSGFRIAEHPSTLNVRRLGHSKMKILTTVAGHLALLTRLAAIRWLLRFRGRAWSRSRQPHGAT